MRTPLTGLQLTLEAGLVHRGDARLRAVLQEALSTTRRLHGTVEEVLRLSRSPGLALPPAPCVPVVGLLRETEEHWHGVLAPSAADFPWPSVVPPHLPCWCRAIPTAETAERGCASLVQR
ncbi:histidine kinase dimerization/phospho-acceptor domain-containing protein [Streptomyces sp. NPDC001102]